MVLSRFGGPDVCAGAYVLDKRASEVHTVLARATILATGGAGKVYLYTSNPDIATGDGVAMAFRGGAEVADMEFTQFHPTALWHPQAKNFLISEALRGEGGVLRLADGTAFMKKHHPQADLAPRDVVARAIDYEMKRTGEDNVWLDMSDHTPDFCDQRFPNIHAECLRWGIDMTDRAHPSGSRGALPVRRRDHGPRRAHVAAGALGHRRGRVHGAARRQPTREQLAARGARLRAHRVALTTSTAAARWPEHPRLGRATAVPSDEAVVVAQNWDEIRRLMWNYVGIVRSNKRLQRAQRRIALLDDEIREYYWEYLVTADLLELRNIIAVARAHGRLRPRTP
jgi:L-aspartate oxidase